MLLKKYGTSSHGDATWRSQAELSKVIMKIRIPSFLRWNIMDSFGNQTFCHSLNTLCSVGCRYCV